MIDVKSLPVNKQFTRRLVKPDTWIINPYDENQAGPHPYVAVGEERAAVFDSTWTKLPLRGYVEEYVTDKPLILVNTHSHLDHTNANWMFNDLPIYMSETAWEEIKERRTLSDEEGRWMGHPKGDYVPNILRPGDVIDLGNRRIEALPYEGIHSSGSLLFLDHKYGVLFTGDEIECGQMLVMGRPGSTNTVEKLRCNVKRLVEEWGGEITMLCPPHNGAPIDPVFLLYIIENCDRIMSGEEEGDMDVGSMSYLYNPMEDRPADRVKAILEDPKIRRSEWKGTSIVFHTDRIFDRQVQPPSSAC